MLPDGTRETPKFILQIFPGLDLHYTDPGQPLTTAGEKLDHLDHDQPEDDLDHVICLICPGCA